MAEERRERRDGFERKQEADALQWYSDAGKRGKHTRSLEHVVKLGIRISERWWGAVKCRCKQEQVGLAKSQPNWNKKRRGLGT